MDVSQINIPSVIPHDSPFCLVDKILSIDKDEYSLTALISISNHMDLCKGHYTKEQIAPGIIVIEALSQCSILCGHAFLSSPEDVKQLHLTVEVQFRFRKPIHYQDEVLLYSKLDKTVNGISTFKVKALSIKSKEVYTSGKITGIALAKPQ